LISRGIPGLDSFLEKYKDYNDMLWGLYRENKIKKEVLNIRRFEVTLNAFGIDDLVLATNIAEDYVSISPRKKNLFPGAVEGLNFLKSKGYPLHIITNGFEEVQFSKLHNSGLNHFFTTITTSEEAGVKKPEPGIFHLALKKAAAMSKESIMIGDDINVDIEGARNIGMDQVLFNPLKNHHEAEINFEMHSWKEIEEIF
jgi:putative hydrolase of the HAD superfamily